MVLKKSLSAGEIVVPNINVTSQEQISSTAQTIHAPSDPSFPPSVPATSSDVSKGPNTTRHRAHSSSLFKMFGHTEKDAPKDKAPGMHKSASTVSLRNLFSASPKMPKCSSFQSLTQFATEEKSYRYKLEDFEPIKQIGSGSYGRIQLCKHKPTNETIVLKTIKISELLQNRQTYGVIREEFKTLMEIVKMDIPFTVKTIGAFHDLSCVHFVMEHVAGGEIFSQLMASRKGYFSNVCHERAVFYAAEVAVALKYMHERVHIVYRDLKTENVMIDEEGHVKIIDFGLVKHLLPGESTKSFVGTPDYMSPEMIKGEPYGYEADIWAFGIFVFEMLMGYPPFNTARPDGSVTFQNIIQTRYAVPFNKDCPPEARDLILRLLHPDKSKRLGARGWLPILQHPWFSGIQWDALINKQCKPPSKHRFQKGCVDVQGTVQREKRKAKASVLGRVDNEDLKLFDDFDAVVRVSVDDNPLSLERKMTITHPTEHDHN